MMKSAFYFMLKAHWVLEISIFLICFFGYVEKPFDNNAMINFKIYDVTDWKTNNYNTHIAQYIKK